MQLHKEGKRAIAIAQLKRVPPASPYYEEAQALIAQWEAEEAAAQAKTGPSPEQQARRDALLEQVKQAQGERRYLDVKSLLDQMATIAPLSPDEQAMRTQAEEQLQPLRKAMSMLHAEEYDQAARQLCSSGDKENADARATAAFYNPAGSAAAGQNRGRREQPRAVNINPADPECGASELAQTWRVTPTSPPHLHSYLNPRPI